MAKRKTIGDNPLDELMQPAQISSEHEKNTTKKEISSTRESTCTAKKQRITVQISTNVIERIKNAVYWTPGLTLAALAEQALMRAVDRLEKEKPFPQRKQELKTGRPIK